MLPPKKLNNSAEFDMTFSIKTERNIHKSLLTITAIKNKYFEKTEEEEDLKKPEEDFKKPEEVSIQQIRAVDSNAETPDEYDNYLDSNIK